MAAAPAIVRADSLMPVRAVPEWHRVRVALMPDGTFEWKVWDDQPVMRQADRDQAIHEAFRKAAMNMDFTRLRAHMARCCVVAPS